MYRYDLLEPSSDANESLDRLTSIFAPLYTKSWMDKKAAVLGNPRFDMNVNAFAGMWLSKALRIFIAYEDNTPVGYLMGLAFRPLTHQSSVFHIEDWYAKHDSRVVLCGLFDFAQDALRFMGTDELWVSRSPDAIYPGLRDSWKRKGETIIDKYGK